MVIFGKKDLENDVIKLLSKDENLKRFFEKKKLKLKHIEFEDTEILNMRLRIVNEVNNDKMANKKNI